MAFTAAQCIQWLREHPEKRRVYQRRWRAKSQRRAEIAGAKQVLLAAHRLRAIGVVTHNASDAFMFDSWALRP